MRIGLFFGSYNPVHMGHLIIANHMVTHTSLDEIWFVVSPQNPFKERPTLLNEYDRLHLVELAVEEDDRFRASNIEFSLPKPSYTIDTLTYLAEKYPNHQFALLMGSDNLNSFKKWKNYKAILKHYSIYIYTRPGYTESELHNHPQVTVLDDVPLLHISATFIRDQVKRGYSIRYLLPDAVRKYILEMGFYKD